MNHIWQMIPGKLWQADIAGSVTFQANCIITCSPLSEFPAMFADLILNRPMHVLFPFLDIPELPDIDAAWIVASLGWGCLSKGKTVVVNCNEGRNRSGLICGLIMKLHGDKNPVETIRAAHPEALTNAVFAQYLREP